MGKGKKVTRDVAEKEVLAWLDYKRIPKKNRFSDDDDEDSGKFSEGVEKLIDCIEEGILSIDQKTFEISHHLVFPIGTDGNEITTITYKPRVTVGEVQNKLKGVKATDGDGRLLSYQSALTGHAKGILKHLDSGDGNIAQTIALFFMV